MRTLRSISIACALACSLVTLLCLRIASAICSPTGNAGLSEVIGSWKIIETRSPRRSRSRCAEAFSRSSPSSSTSPPAMRPGGCGTRPMMESAVTLLPQPDSPTMPSVRPRCRLKSTPSTARTSPRSVAKCVRSPRTSSSGVRSMGGDLPLELFPVEQTPRPRPARAAAQVGDEALVRFGVQARQLGEWLGMVVDPQAELGVGLGRVDEQRGRLLAALVAARRLAGLQRRDELLRKCACGCLEGARGFLDHAAVRQHVAGHRKAVPGEQ